MTRYKISTAKIIGCFKVIFIQYIKLISACIHSFLFIHAVFFKFMLSLLNSCCLFFKINTKFEHYFPLYIKDYPSNAKPVLLYYNSPWPSMSCLCTTRSIKTGFCSIRFNWTTNYTTRYFYLCLNIYPSVSSPWGLKYLMTVCQFLPVPNLMIYSTANFSHTKANPFSCYNSLQRVNPWREWLQELVFHVFMFSFSVVLWCLKLVG